MNWGAKIALSFIVFAIMIFTMVYISVNQDVNLVAEDYYKQEIRYQDQIERMKNTKQLSDRPVIVLNKEGQQVIVTFPEKLAGTMVSGSIHLFRPADYASDFQTGLTLDDNNQAFISLSGKPAGLWKVKLTWRDGEKEYYDEKVIVNASL
jgi:hypothetical protein